MDNETFIKTKIKKQIGQWKRELWVTYNRTLNKTRNLSMLEMEH